MRRKRNPGNLLHRTTTATAIILLNHNLSRQLCKSYILWCLNLPKLQQDSLASSGSRSSSTVTEVEVWGHEFASEVEGEEGTREGAEEECLDDDPIVEVVEEKVGEQQNMENQQHGWETDMSPDQEEPEEQPNPPYVSQSVHPDQVETLPLEPETLEYVVDSQWKLERMKEEEKLQREQAEASGAHGSTGDDAVAEEIESDDDKKTWNKDYSILTLTCSNLLSVLIVYI